MQPIFLVTMALALVASLRFLFVAKASTILRVSFTSAVLVSLLSLYLPSPPPPALTPAFPQLLAVVAAGLVGLGLTAHWLLRRSPDGLGDGTADE